MIIILIANEHLNYFESCNFYKYSPCISENYLIPPCRQEQDKNKSKKKNKKQPASKLFFKLFTAEKEI